MYFLVLKHNLMLFPYISHTVSVGVFLSSPQPPFLLPLFGLSLISYSTLASGFFKQLVFGWAPTSNIHFKGTEISHVKKKKKKSPQVLFAQHCHTLSIPPSLFLSIHPSIRSSPPKMLFVYHHWSILAPGCCIRISTLTSADVYCMCAYVHAWAAVLLNHFWFHRELVHPCGWSQEPAVGCRLLQPHSMVTWR